MVRAGALSAEDMVRVEGQHAWQTADTVVGLFYLANHGGSLASQSEQTSHDFGPEDLDFLDQGEPVDDVRSGDPGPLASGTEEQPAWQRRLVEVAMQRKVSLPARTSTRTPGIPAPSASSSGVSSAIDAATNAITRNDAIRREGRRHAHLSIEGIARVLIVLLAANLTGLGIVRWTEREATRFPDITSQARHFPLRGKCSPTEYLILLTGTMNLAALAGYGVTRSLGNR